MSQTIPERDEALDHDSATTSTLRVEAHGIDYIPSSERRGRPSQLFGVWAAANVSFLALIVGSILVSLGLNIWQAIIVIVVGNAFTVFSGIISASGPASGTPSEVIMRAMFGVRGNRINVAIAGWLVSICYLALNWSAASVIAFGLLETAGVETSLPVKVIVILAIAAVTLFISVYGHGLITRLYQSLAIILAVVFAVMAVIIIVGADWNYQPAAALEGWDLFAMMAAGVTIVASGPLSYTNSADFARYLPRSTSPVAVAAWTTLGACVPSIAISTVGALAATTLDMSSPSAALTEALPAWFAPVFLIAVIVGTIANNAMTAYSSGLALQSIGVPLKRSQSVLLDGVVGVAMTLFALLVWNFLDSVSNMMQLIVIIVGPAMAVYTVDLFWRRNRYNGILLSDESRTSPFWYTGGFNIAGFAAVILGGVLGLMFAAAPVYVGPLAAALGGVDLSLPVAMVVSGAVYLMAMNRYPAAKASLR